MSKLLWKQYFFITDLFCHLIYFKYFRHSGKKAMDLTRLLKGFITQKRLGNPVCTLASLENRLLKIWVASVHPTRGFVIYFSSNR
jgi:hypothetical protein